MALKTGFVLGITVSLILISTSFVFSQEQAAQEQAEEPAAQESPSESEILWLWGEVASVDLEKSQLLIKYLDYDTDEEKEIKININDQTTYENVKSVDEIKPQDTVSIDYITDSEGNNIAKNISIEKLEESPVPLEQENIPQETAKPSP